MPTMSKRKAPSPKKKPFGEIRVRPHKTWLKGDLQKLADQKKGGNLNLYLNTILELHVKQSLMK